MENTAYVKISKLVDLTYADLTLANLQNARLQYSNLQHVNFTNANLKDEILSDANCTMTTNHYDLPRYFCSTSSIRNGKLGCAKLNSGAGIRLC